MTPEAVPLTLDVPRPDDSTSRLPNPKGSAPSEPRCRCGHREVDHGETDQDALGERYCNLDEGGDQACRCAQSEPLCECGHAEPQHKTWEARTWDNRTGDYKGCAGWTRFGWGICETKCRAFSARSLGVQPDQTTGEGEPWQYAPSERTEDARPTVQASTSSRAREDVTRRGVSGAAASTHVAPFEFSAGGAASPVASEPSPVLDLESLRDRAEKLIGLFDAPDAPQTGDFGRDVLACVAECERLRALSERQATAFVEERIAHNDTRARLEELTEKARTVVDRWFDAAAPIESMTAPIDALAAVLNLDPSEEPHA